MHSVKSNKSTKLSAVLALVFYCMAHPSMSVAEVQLNFGVYTTEKPTTMARIYRPILTELEKALEDNLNEPTTINLQVASTYDEGIRALIDGDVDFALLGPASYIMAKEQNGSIRILALDSKDQSKTFSGVICVSENSPIKDIADLRGKTFAFGNESSTIGRYLSQQHLTEHGIYANDLAKFEYLGRHDRVGYAVNQGLFDAGALREGTFKKLKDNGLALRALATFPNVNRPWVARAGLSDRLFNALRRTMLNLTAPEAFKKLRRKHFVSGADGDFVRIRSAIRQNSNFFKSMPVQGPISASEQ